MPDASTIYAELRRSMPAVAWLPEECWIVGGSLRDVILGTGPKDVDCAAPAAERAATDFAARVGGRKVCLARQPLETWRVVLNGLDWDFTDIDGGSIDADLARRDFTIGALALSVRAPHELRDPFGGLGDLERRIVRMISPGNLEADPLRMLRAVRLAARLGFDIDRETMEFISANSGLLRASAAERITTEVDAILLSADVARGLELLVALGLDREIFQGGLDQATARRCAGIFTPDAVTRYAAIFAGRSDRLDEHAQSARWSRDRRRDVAALIELTTRIRERKEEGCRDLPLLVHQYGSRTARRSAELLASFGEVDCARRLASLVRERGRALEDIRPILDGREIRAILGFDDGPEIGAALRRLTEAQIRGEVKTRDEAVAFVRRQLQTGE